MEGVLHRAVIDASHAYSVVGREIRALERACRAVEWARCVLDDAVCREQPRSDWSVTDAYYPRENALAGSEVQNESHLSHSPKISGTVRGE